MLTRITSSLAVLMTMAWAGSASATLIGDSVNASWSSPNGVLGIVSPFTSPQTVILGGPEFTGVASRPGTVCDPCYQLDLDINDSSFDFNVGQLGTFTGTGSGPSLLRLDITGLDWVDVPGQIVGISGGDSSVFSFGFGANSVFVEFTSVSVDAGPIHFDIEVQHEVPGPSTLALFSLGLAGLGFARRKKS